MIDRYVSDKYNFNLPVYNITHHNCTDGFASHWSLVQAFGEDNVEYVAGRRTELPDLVQVPQGSTVIITDFSYTRELMIELAQRSDQVIVLDHHASAEKDLDGLDEEIDNLTIVFDMDRSGAGITWDEFFAPVTDRPRMLDYIEDRDLWNNSMPNYLEVGAYVQNVPRNLKAYDKLISTPITQVILEGKGAYATRKMMFEDAARSAVLGRFEIEGYGTIEMPVTNCTYPIGSEAAEVMTQMYDYPLAAYFLHNGSGTISYGFRSRDDGVTDVSIIAGAIAAQHGPGVSGGGHVSASGVGPFASPIHEVLDAPPAPRFEEAAQEQA